MRRDLLRRLQRFLFLVSVLLFLIIGILVAQAAGYVLPSPQALLGLGPASEARPRVVLISGHAGYDSGAVCTDAAGRTTLTEAEVNARVAGQAARILRAEGVDVEIFEEYDERLNGLQADALLSLHADSCVEYSGYKAASRAVSVVAAQDARLIACIDRFYPLATGLEYHPYTVTRDMIGYHAFRRVAPSTPAAILEMGFLGGDRMLLTDHVDRVARGVAESILCFLEPAQGESSPPAPTLTPNP